MLYLQRKAGQMVVVTVPPSDVETIMTVYVVRAAKVCNLGFEVDRSVQILRGELVARDQKRIEDANGSA